MAIKVKKLLINGPGEILILSIKLLPSTTTTGQVCI